MNIEWIIHIYDAIVIEKLPFGYKSQDLTTFDLGTPVEKAVETVYNRVYISTAPEERKNLGNLLTNGNSHGMMHLVKIKRKEEVNMLMNISVLGVQTDIVSGRLAPKEIVR